MIEMKVQGKDVLTNSKMYGTPFHCRSEKRPCKSLGMNMFHVNFKMCSSLIDIQIIQALPEKSRRTMDKIFREFPTDVRLGEADGMDGCHKRSALLPSERRSWQRILKRLHNGRGHTLPRFGRRQVTSANLLTPSIDFCFKGRQLLGIGAIRREEDS